MNLTSVAIANLIWIGMQCMPRRTRWPAAMTWRIFFYAMLPLEFFVPGVSLALPLIALALRILSFITPGVLGDLLWIAVSGATGFMFATFVLLFYPRHRRLGWEWFPSRLPALPSRGRGGMTLIELLIDIAIIVILCVGVTHVVSATRLAQTRLEDGRAALDLIQDEFALLRAQGSVPALGTHPVDAALAPDHPLAARAEVEVKPGPSASLREVWVRVRLSGVAGGTQNARDVALAALLPAGGAGAAEGVKP
jgi:type II secretory pathway pseudopilin PulG